MGHNGTGVTKDVYINLPEEIYDCEKVIGNFIIDILPQTDFVFDIQISENRNFAFNNRILRFAGCTLGKTEDSIF